MPEKKAPQLVIVDEEDGGLVIAPDHLPTEGETNPIDELTGDSTFDDLDSRFNLTDADRAELSRSRTVEPEEELDEDEEEEDPDEAPRAADEDETPDADEEEEPEAPRKDGSWQKRLKREQRLRHELKEDYNDVRAQLQELRSEIGVRQSDDKFATKITTLDTQIAAQTAALKQAKEDGDTDKEVAITDKLIDLKAEKRSETTAHEAAKAAVKKQGTTANRIVLRRVEQWTRKHQRFTTDPIFGSFVKAIDSSIVREGGDPESDEFWEELDRRVAERYPEEYKGRKLAQKGREHRQAPTLNLGRGDRGGVPRRAKTTQNGEFEVKGGRVHLTASHKRIMQDFGLDPTNTEDVKSFVSSNR